MAQTRDQSAAITAKLIDRTPRRAGLCALGAFAVWVISKYVITDHLVFLSYVRALAWPLVVLALLYWLRNPILRKADDLLRLEAFGATATFVEKSGDELDKRIREPAKELLAERDPKKARTGLDEIIRESARWGYELASRGAGEASNTYAASPDRAVQDSRMRVIESLENEIKALERERHSPSIGLGKSAANYLWLTELRKRLSKVDPENPWAADRL